MTDMVVDQSFGIAGTYVDCLAIAGYVTFRIIWNRNSRIEVLSIPCSFGRFLLCLEC